jgi:hypothetical protein
MCPFPCFDYFLTDEAERKVWLRVKQSLVFNLRIASVVFALQNLRSAALLTRF